GLLIGLAMGRNLLEFGSGKTGATNTLRTLGLGAGVAVFVFDVIKGALPVVAARLLAWPDDTWTDIAVGCAGAAAIVGHNWSVWVRLLAGRWGGGRGIMTALGAGVVATPVVVLVAAAAGGLGLAVTRYVVVGALVGALAAIVGAVVLTASGQMSVWLFLGVVAWALLVIWGFQDSIYRLRRGTERRLGD
ncbi:MAG: glycerol-3-phosphate acyltransferase, partial [Chloroflexia bacterium]